jgi:hypothetical protein
MIKRYQRSNQNPYIEEEQTTQWPKDTKGVFNIQILITPLVSFGHCVVCSSSIYWFWLLLWYLLVIVKRYQRGNQNQYIEEEQTTQWSKDTKEVIRICILKKNNYTFGIFWSLCCLFFFNILILITSLVSFGHCVVCSSSIYWKDTKEVIRIRILKKNKQHNDQKIPKE